MTSTLETLRNPFNTAATGIFALNCTLQKIHASIDPLALASLDDCSIHSQVSEAETLIGQLSEYRTPLP
jgi:hypothetical protein